MAKKDIIVLACGGRYYDDKLVVWDTLSRLHRRRGIRRLVHGAAPGADFIAAQWAEAFGVEVAAYPAQWKVYGPSAGPVRNQHMIISERLDLVLAFPGGRGTEDMVRRATRAGIAVTRILSDGSTG